MGYETKEIKELKEYLAKFSPESVQEAVSALQKEEYPIKTIHDFEDPGPEVEIGNAGRVSLEDMGYLERVILEPNFLPVHFLEEGAIAQKAVARVTLTESHAGLSAGSGWGTGFLVSPSLFMTNNHVIPTTAFARKVEMQFNYQLDYKGNPQNVDTYTTDPDSVFYTNAALDFTLIRLNPHCRYVLKPVWTGSFHSDEETDFGPDMSGCEERLAGLEPTVTTRPYVGLPRNWPGDLRRYRRICTNPGVAWGHLKLQETISYAGPSGVDPGQHINIIQHPKGRRKEVALQRNNLTNIYANRIRYTTDTEPGSSGSAVFNNGWDLIAIHHAAGEWDASTSSWVSNEGMRIDQIVADLKSHYGGTTTGNQILNELGL